ncbi:Rieske 2Fe-2S domain-containing protein [Beggiatoa alba]|nr:Rieske 2Fe-2S domain-containing protein [Beggiatoa alba]
MTGKLIKISEIGHLSAFQCLSLEIAYKDSTFEILLVCYASNSLAAYFNQCPHTGVNLNWLPDQCFDFTQRYLVCSVHGALFKPDDGLCIHGPCVGEYLIPIELVVEQGNVLIDPEKVKKCQLQAK